MAHRKSDAPFLLKTIFLGVVFFCHAGAIFDGDILMSMGAIHKGVAGYCHIVRKMYLDASARNVFKMVVLHADIFVDG